MHISDEKRQLMRSRKEDLLFLPSMHYFKSGSSSPFRIPIGHNTFIRLNWRQVFRRVLQISINSMLVYLTIKVLDYYKNNLQEKKNISQWKSYYLSKQKAFITLQAACSTQCVNKIFNTAIFYQCYSVRHWKTPSITVKYSHRNWPSDSWR